jgi:hypothetical protein
MSWKLAPLETDEYTVTVGDKSSVGAPLTSWMADDYSSTLLNSLFDLGLTQSDFPEIRKAALGLAHTTDGLSKAEQATVVQDEADATKREADTA